jgi:NADH-quinone oxidoreductase subunit J
METWLFYIFGAIALAAALLVLMLQRVFYAALALIVCLSALAGIYMLLEAPFIAAVQIIVYAGAIMVMFLFVILLLDPFSASRYPDKKKYIRYFALILGGASLLLLIPMLATFNLSRTPHDPQAIPGGPGSITHLAATLFSEYLLPFEVTSILILVAIIGAVVLARRPT